MRSIPSTARGPFLYSRTSPRTSIPFPSVTVPTLPTGSCHASAALQPSGSSGSGSRRRASRHAGRRRRPSRSADTCRRFRPTARASARSRACPRSSAHARRRACGRRCGSRLPSRCATPFTNTSNGRTTSAGSRTRVPRYEPSGTFIEWQPVAVSSLLAQFAPGRARVAERGGDPRQLALRLDLRLRDLPPRRGAADRVRLEVPPPEARTLRGRARRCTARRSSSSRGRPGP